MPNNRMRRLTERLTSSHKQIQSIGKGQRILIAPLYASDTPLTDLPNAQAIAQDVSELKTYVSQVSYGRMGIDVTALRPIRMFAPLQFYVNTKRGGLYRQAFMHAQMTRRFLLEAGSILVPSGNHGTKKFQITPAGFSPTTFSHPGGYHAVIRRHSDGTLLWGHSRGISWTDSSGRTTHLATNQPVNDIVFDQQGHVIVAQGVDGVVAYRKSGQSLTEVQRVKPDYPVIALVKHVDVIYAICSKNIVVLRINRAVGTINEISTIAEAEPTCGHIAGDRFYLGTSKGISVFDASSARRESPLQIASSFDPGFVTAIGSTQTEVIVGTLQRGIFKSPQIIGSQSTFRFDVVTPFASQDRPDLMPGITTQISSDGSSGFFALILGRGLRHYIPNAQGKYLPTHVTAVPGISEVDAKSLFMQTVESLKKWVRDYYQDGPEPSLHDGDSGEVFSEISDLFHTEVFTKAEELLDQADAARLLVKSYGLVSIGSPRLRGQGRGLASSAAHNDMFGVSGTFSATTSITCGAYPGSLNWPTLAHEMSHVMKLQETVPGRANTRGMPDIDNIASGFCLMGEVDGHLPQVESALLFCGPHLVRTGFYSASDVAVVNVQADLSQPKEFLLVEHGVTSAKDPQHVRAIRVKDNGIEKIIELRSQPQTADQSVLFDAVVRPNFGSIPNTNDPTTYPHPDHGVLVFTHDGATPNLELIDPFKEIPGFRSTILRAGDKKIIPLVPPGTPKPRGHISNNYHPDDWVLVSSLTLDDIKLRIETVQRVSENPRCFKVKLSRVA